jgi:hypothetical protein
MSTNRINQTDLANKLKVSRQAINKAIRKGQLVKHGEGRAAYIDLKCPLTVAYMKNGTEQRHGNAQGKPKARTPKPPGKPGKAAPPKTAKESAPESPSNDESVQAFVSNEAIKKLKIEEELEKLKLNNRKVRGELIERATVQAFVHSMHEIDNGQWKTLGLKISSDVAAKLDIDDDVKVRAICDVIDREVLAVLKQVKRDQNRFLKKIGAEKIPKKGKAA